MSTQELALYTPGVGTELQLARKPDEVIAESIEVAKSLKEIVTKTNAIQKIGESEHLKLEAWQTLGNFYGLVGKINRTEFVEFGCVSGFKAYADLVHVASGKIVSSAEAMCLNDEEKWSDRPKYEYHYILKDGSTAKDDPGWNNMQTEPNPKKLGKMRPKRKRVQIGVEKVPMYQLLSMAETRANSKVHSMALRWIVVLAGYAPTPAEEADPAGIGDDDENFGAPEERGLNQQPRKSATAKSVNGNAAPVDQSGQGASKYITQEQINKIWGAGYAANQYHKSLEKNQIEELIHQCGFPRSDKIPADQFERVYRSVYRGEVMEDEPGPEVGAPV
ncbi:MAG: hypothetical protein JXA73_08935 [Acidobacteria bacterium]|nr:hypothetical protein [Acidobacteriota bacterium]